MKRNQVIIIIALLIAIAAVFAAKESKNTTTPQEAIKQDTTTETVAPDNKAEEEVAVAEPIETAKTELPTLIDLGAGKCIPCKMMMPVLEELEQSYNDSFHVKFIDVWENPDEGKAYNIKLIPTQIFIDATGTELFRHEGFFSKEEILEKWKEFGVITEITETK